MIKYMIAAAVLALLYILALLVAGVREVILYNRSKKQLKAAKKQFNPQFKTTYK